MSASAGEWPDDLRRITFRTLVYRLLREEEMCPGIAGSDTPGESHTGPRYCPRARTVRCAECRTEWEADDTGPADHALHAYTGPCPNCNSTALTLSRCSSCPAASLEEARSVSDAGRLLDLVLEHEFDAKHYHVQASEVRCEVRDGYKILEQERSKWERETAKRREVEMEHRRRLEMFSRGQR